MPCAPPIGTLYATRPLSVHTGVVRRLQIPTPGGRSFSSPSPLSSKPVISMYGNPSEALTDPFTLRFLNCVLVTPTLTLYGLSAGPLPHSVSRLPLAGTS